MSLLPLRKTHHLRRGRVSLPGGRYFLTLCTHARQPVFAQEPEVRRVASALHAIHADGDIDLLAATVMPDHVHLLFILGQRLSLGQVMAKLKNLTRDGGMVSWRWQEDGFEHHLRPHETTEDYGFYIFMQPSLRPDETYPEKLRRLLKPLLASCLTTVAGFALLLFSDLPFIRQLGVFVGAGLISALAGAIIYFSTVRNPFLEARGFRGAAEIPAGVRRGLRRVLIVGGWSRCRA